MNNSNLQSRQYGVVYIDTDPHGALIIVDGQIQLQPDTEEYVKTPAKLLLIEGRRDIVLRIENYDDYVMYVDVYPNTTVSKYARMKTSTGKTITPLAEREPPVWSPYYGYLQRGDIAIESNPNGADVYLDDQPLLDSSGKQLKTPVLVTGVVEGYHKVTYSMEGYYTKSLIVDVLPLVTNDACADLNPMI